MARGRGWSVPETLHMLGLVEQILPFGSNLWKTVHLQYEATGEPSIVEPLPRRLKRVVLITSMWTYQLWKLNLRRDKDNPASHLMTAEFRRHLLLDNLCLSIIDSQQRTCPDERAKSISTVTTEPGETRQQSCWRFTAATTLSRWAQVRGAQGERASRQSFIQEVHARLYYSGRCAACTGRRLIPALRPRVEGIRYLANVCDRKGQMGIG
ncbi:hypothetical protein GQ600_624 [Phytophthora cactorum]|nr:hypothetical protein GQ600_624 [Phytophthora cactorum]